jgi:hypothetical protein
MNDLIAYIIHFGLLIFNVVLHAFSEKYVDLLECKKAKDGKGDLVK